MLGDRGVVTSARPGCRGPGRERLVLQDVVPAPEIPTNNDILEYKAAVAGPRAAVAGDRDAAGTTTSNPVIPCFAGGSQVTSNAAGAAAPARAASHRGVPSGGGYAAQLWQPRCQSSIPRPSSKAARPAAPASA